MFRVHKVKQQIKRIHRKLPKRSRRRFKNGLAAFSLNRFTSLNQAARQLANYQGIKVSTATARVYHTLGDQFLGNHLQQILIAEVLSGRTGRLYLNLDHVTLGNCTVAVLAVQTSGKQSLPFWVQVNSGKNNAAIEPLIKNLIEFLRVFTKKSFGLQIYLVGDRFFGTERLINFCSDNQLKFIFRTTSNKLVQTSYDRRPIAEIADYDSIITYRDLDLRLVMSDWRPGMAEAWFLLTNIDDQSRKQILKRYEQRWQIEVGFKDIKHVQKLTFCRIKKPGHLRVLLLFIASVWIMLYQATPKKELFKSLKSLPPKKRLTWFNFLFQQFLLSVWQPSQSWRELLFDPG